MSTTLERILNEVTQLPESEQRELTALLNERFDSDFLELGSKHAEDKLAKLRAEISIGITQADQGDFVEFSADEIISEGRARRASLIAS